MITLEFSGAAQNVTGSKHLLTVNGKRILLDCGLFQGRRKEADEANRHFPFKATDIDAVVLSHAHMDHAGELPLLHKYGYDGPIYCTHATRDLCTIMLKDAAHIQEVEAKELADKGSVPLDPLYTIEDAEAVMANFRSVDYGKTFFVEDNVQCTFSDAGHILGSAMELLELKDTDTGQTIRLGFTGDLGRRDLPILKNPSQLRDLDVLITESTYGNRNHDEVHEAEIIVAHKVKEAIERGGKVIIPAFSVGRTQEMLYIFKELREDNLIPTVPIFVDSPLSVKATEIFRIHTELFDTETKALYKEGKDPFAEIDGVEFISDLERSKELQMYEGSCIILSASGMCEAGRVRHHLANHMSDPRNLILIVGFMAENTLGRKFMDKEPIINLFGEERTLNAEVYAVNAFSGHADQKGLLSFAKKSGHPTTVFLVHGEPEPMNTLAEELSKLNNLHSSSIFIPCPGETFRLTEGKKWMRTGDVNAISAAYMPSNSYACSVIKEIYKDSNEAKYSDINEEKPSSPEERISERERQKEENILEDMSPRERRRYLRHKEDGKVKRKRHGR